MFNLWGSPNPGLGYYFPMLPPMGPVNYTQNAICSCQQCYNLLNTAMRDKPTDCRICEKHLKGPISYKCDECPKIFDQKESLESHLISHAEKPLKIIPFVCELCGKQFNVWIEMMEHKALHSDARAFYCDECNRRFPLRSIFKDHLNVHTGRKPYECDKCEKKYSNRVSLTSHKVVHSGIKRFKCEHCDKKYFYKSELNSHLQVHSNVIKSFKCDHCEKSFVSKSKLQRHSKVHTQLLTNTRQWPFKCEYCPKSFKFNASLEYHMTTHPKINYDRCSRVQSNDEQELVSCIKIEPE